ncbi:MAG: hypothetical protein OXF41_02665 [bacterium]|nr:hypothetical protein [bacterium]
MRQRDFPYVWRSGRTHPGVTKLAVAARTVALSLSIYLVVAAAFVIHFAIGWTTFEQEDLEFGFLLLWALLIVVWPTSVPLSLALILLHRRSRLTAYLCAALLVPLSIAGFIVAGLLLSEVAAILVAALSLPAWIALLAVNWRQSRTRSSVPS